MKEGCDHKAGKDKINDHSKSRWFPILELLCERQSKNQNRGTDYSCQIDLTHLRVAVHSIVDTGDSAATKEHADTSEVTAHA